MSNLSRRETVAWHDGELNQLHVQTLSLGSAVMDRLKRSLEALRTKDAVIAHDVLENRHDACPPDVPIDDARVEAVIACESGTCSLRAITCVSKAVTDLERIGEQVARMAHETLHIYEGRHVHPGAQLMREVYAAGQLALALLQGALESFDDLDAHKARTLACEQQELATGIESILLAAAAFLTEDSRNVGQTLRIILLVTEIERIGQHARDLAEYVYYMVEGGNREPCAKTGLVTDAIRNVDPMGHAAPPH